MITVKQYADERGITIQAVHQSMNGKRKKDRLEGHVQVIDGVKWLDEEAIAILDEARNKSPIVWEKTDANARIEELEQNEKIMLAKIAAQADRISDLAQWKADNAVAIAAANQTQLLLDTTRAELEQAKEYGQQTSQEAAEARQEAAEAIDKANRLDDLLGKVQGERDAAEASKKALEDEVHLLRQENEQLRNRKLGDYIKGWFKKRESTEQG